MKIINFIIIGAMKSGTTSLAKNLAEHPQICFCKKKEPMFFHQKKWKDHIGEYHNLYNPKFGQICGEASTTYTSLTEYPDTPYNLYQYNPNLKLIYIIRNPVDRIVSHYMHNVLNHGLKSPFENAIKEDSIYIDRSRYYFQISKYLQYFNRDQIMLIIFKDYIHNQRDVLKDVYKFLGLKIDINYHINSEPQNASINSIRMKDWARKLYKNKYIRSFLHILITRKLKEIIHKRLVFKIDKKPEISREIKEKILEMIKNDIIEIEKLTDRDLAEWKTIN